MSFKLGDVVMLKSGGPKMTIASLKQDRAFCVWFNQRDQYHEERSGEFLIETLRPSGASARVAPAPPAVSDTDA